MMQDAEELLNKYNSGQATEAERALVESWYLHYKTGPSDLTPEQLQQEHEAGLRALNARLHRQQTARLWPRIAAAATILLGIVWGWQHYRPVDKPVVGHPVQTAAIKPGSNKAILTLSDGSTISLTDAGNGELAEQAGTKIIKQADGQLFYKTDKAALTPSERAGGEASIRNILTIPRGGQYQLQLPDGTKVWLNSASSLRYPSKFDNSERRVELSGEAYFEVAKKVEGSKAEGRKVPFIVVTENQEVEVLGTHFNIHAYPDEEKASTTLLEGSVRVRVRHTAYSGLLRPGQQAQVKPSEPVQIRSVNTDDAIAWKEGYFVFEDADIRTIMNNLARWYDVEVVYQGVVTNQTFGGAFPRSAALGDLLKYLETYGNIHFAIEGRRVRVMP
ncbi:FecR family protein [Pedobacter sp. BS3]|uniref:FecR family protein n=1 Tax=Pedobacter sp. BS3 TaxID=2567937 RepID=UPI0011EC0136|nr:FecR family protein [Pedobacter sp. BS3]TZF83113.1 FecR family protein [Pedobacter sp. BS3]